MASQEVAAGENVKLLYNGFVNDGYTFRCWSKDAVATTTYAENQEIRLTESMELYAIWDKNPTVTYTITYDVNGGTGSVESQTVTAGTEVTVGGLINGEYCVTMDGYGLDGWSYERMEPYDAGGPYVESETTYPGAKIIVNSDITLYAMWIQASSSNPDNSDDPEDYVSSICPNSTNGKHDYDSALGEHAALNTVCVKCENLAHEEQVICNKCGRTGILFSCNICPILEVYWD